jgi:hypothetical protein
MYFFCSVEQGVWKRVTGVENLFQNVPVSDVFHLLAGYSQIQI